MKLSLSARFELLIAKIRSHAIELRAYRQFVSQLASERQAATVLRLQAERLEISDEYLGLLGEAIEQRSVQASLLETARQSLEKSDDVLMQLEKGISQ